MKKLVLLLFATFFSLAYTYSQQRTCASTEYLEQQKLEDPEREARMQAIERQLQQFISQQGGIQDRVVYTIPVVVHVIWKTTAQNISDAQVQSQIDVLNEDFRRLNANANNNWSQAADVELEFCLATKDPNGANTTGITRRQTTVSAFNTNDNMKFTSSGGTNAWPTGDYLNIWVCNLGSGLLGYAQFPGGPTNTDGVVVDFAYFGRGGSAQAPFDQGRTGTHEVGHWLNLYHIWGDGGCNVDDQVADTPGSDAPNYGCPAGHVSCGTLDMIENYMDYTDDACMNLFTQGQKTRMRALFAPGGARYSLLNSNGCNGGSNPTCEAPTGLTTSGVTSNAATASWSAANNAQNYNVQIAVAGSNSWTTYNTASTSYSFSGLQSCTNYQVRVQTVCSGGSSAYSSASSFSTTGCPSGCQDNEVTYTLVTDGYGSETTWELRDDSGTLIQSGGPYANNTTYNFTFCLPDDCYTFTIFDSYGDGICCAYGNGSYLLKDANNNTLASGGQFGSSESTNFCFGGPPPPPPPSGCTDNFEPNNTRGTAPTVSVGTTINALISSSTDVDWFKFRNTTSQRNIRVDLTNLPDDYDMELYRGSTLVGWSENSGTQDESIVYNTTRVTNYFVKVYGWDGANDPDNCYDLLISLSSSSFRNAFEDLALEKVTNHLEFKVMPNPVREVANLEFQPTAEAPVRIILTDLTGRRVREEVVNLAKSDFLYKMEVADLPSGVYLVTAFDGKERFSNKIVVQK